MRLDEHAESTPDKPAVIMAGSGDTISFGTLVDRARRLGHLLRDSGIAEGDSIAFMLGEPAGILRLRLWRRKGWACATPPINWHLQPAEAAYILKDCSAKLFALSDVVARHAPALAEVSAGISQRLAVGGTLPWLPRLRLGAGRCQGDTRSPIRSKARRCSIPLERPASPKGCDACCRARNSAACRCRRPGSGCRRSTASIRPVVYLCPAPLYHAAPIAFSMVVQRCGGTVVVMEHSTRWRRCA
ncbi:MAG: AMP-binding protein [Aliidongia sp.]